MIARAVIGANFGDEGKGLVTSYMCAQGAGVVVRFNGGAQAGHTVVMPNGDRHIFRHMGAGTLQGVPTFLSQFFVCNPLLFYKEMDVLYAMGLSPSVYAHPDCLVTTFADMMINQELENKRGSARHGSCGLGLHETIERSQIPELKITMSDLWNGINTSKLEQICDKYAKFRIGKAIDEPQMIEAFIKCCWAFAEQVHPAGIGQCKDPVFEGAQGLLLDQNNKAMYPHLTRSNTGIKNVRELCTKAGIDKIEAYYVSRTYVTRHGAGPLLAEDKSLRFEDSTNQDHPFQGQLRFAPLDSGLQARCKADYGNDGFNIVLTHCDQLEPQIEATLYAYGPTFTTIYDHKRHAEEVALALRTA